MFFILVNNKYIIKFIKEIESLLNSERSKSKDLANKLYKTQAELNMIKTQGPIALAPMRLNFEATSPINNKSTKISQHSQPASLHKLVIYFKINV